MSSESGAVSAERSLGEAEKQTRIKEILRRKNEIFDRVGIINDIPVIRYDGEEAYEKVRKKMVGVMPEVAELYVEFLQLKQPAIVEKPWDTDLSVLRTIRTDYEMGNSHREGAPTAEEILEFSARYVDMDTVDVDIYPREEKYPYAYASPANPPSKPKHEIVANFRGGVRDALDLTHEFGHVAQFQRVPLTRLREIGFIGKEAAAIAVELRFHLEKNLAATGEDIEKSYLINVPRYEFERRAILAVRSGELTKENAYEYLSKMWSDIKAEYFDIQNDGSEIDALQMPHPFMWAGGQNLGYVVAYLAAKKSMEDEEIFKGILEGRYSSKELTEIAGLGVAES